MECTLKNIASRKGKSKISVPGGDNMQWLNLDFSSNAGNHIEVLLAFLRKCCSNLRDKRKLVISLVKNILHTLQIKKKDWNMLDFFH